MPGLQQGTHRQEVLGYLTPPSPLQNSCMSVSSKPGLSAPSSPQGSRHSSRESLHSWVLSCHVLPDHRQGRTTVNGKRDSLSCVTLQSHDFWCRIRLTTLHTVRHSPSSSPASIRPSLLLARPSAQSAQHADSQLCSVPTVPSTLGRRSAATKPLFASFCPSSP